MVPDAARIKLLERIEMAVRLGGEFSAEAHGMGDALNELTSVGASCYEGARLSAYERGYRDAKEIITVEATLAARVKKAV